MCVEFFFSSKRRHTIYWRDWSSGVCSSDLGWFTASSGAFRLVVKGYPTWDDAPWDIPADLRYHDEDDDYTFLAGLDRKSVVEGKSVDLGGRRIIKKKNTLPRYNL